MTATAADVQAALAAQASAADAVHLQRFFKTGPGDYAAGDVFIGVRVPETRKVAKEFRELPGAELDVLLDSPVHEHRLAALIVMNAQYKRAPAETVERYLAAVRRGRVNNWDLVDVSAENILGPWLYERDRALLDEFAASESLWERRVAVLTTFAFIKRGDPSTTLALAVRLLPDRADLIQKAVGWMLREVGKKVDRAVLTGFLDTHAPDMGRTALSYATEHLDPEVRAAYRAMR